MLEYLFIDLDFYPKNTSFKTKYISYAIHLARIRDSIEGED